MRCEQLNVDKVYSPRCFKLCAKSIVEKLVVFHSEMEPGPDRGREFAGRPLFSSAALVVPKHLVGDGESLIHLFL